MFLKMIPSVKEVVGRLLQSSDCPCRRSSNVWLESSKSLHDALYPADVSLNGSGKPCIVGCFGWYRQLRWLNFASRIPKKEEWTSLKCNRNWDPKSINSSSLNSHGGLTDGRRHFSSRSSSWSLHKSTFVKRYGINQNNPILSE